MHRSRVSTLLIDVPTEQAATSVSFWSAALGVEAAEVPDEEQYTSLPQAVPGLVTAVQTVDDAPRYHLDFETDDLEAGTRRLVASARWRCRAGWTAAPSASRMAIWSA